MLVGRQKSLIIFLDKKDKDRQLPAYQLVLVKVAMRAARSSLKNMPIPPFMNGILTRPLLGKVTAPLRDSAPLMVG